MAMATQGQVAQYRGNLRSSPEPSTNTNTSSGSHGTGSSSIATNRWGPYSGAGDFASNMAVVLAALLASLALGLALNAAVRYLLRGHRRRGGAARGDGGDPEANRNRSGRVPEKPAPPPPPSLALVHYSAAAAGSEFLAGAAAAECAICLAEFADGDAVRVMPACRHGFHARCIELWLARGRRSSCPTCRAPAVAAAVVAAAAQPAADDESSAAPAPSASASS